MFRYLKNVDVKNNLSCDLPHVHLFDIVSFVYTLILMHIISLFLYSIVAVCVICFFAVVCLPKQRWQKPPRWKIFSRGLVQECLIQNTLCNHSTQYDTINSVHAVCVLEPPEKLEEHLLKKMHVAFCVLMLDWMIL